MKLKILPVLVLMLVALGCGGGLESGNTSQADEPMAGGAEVSGKEVSPTR
jgi:uncharacterized spore protein YtfJ